MSFNTLQQRIWKKTHTQNTLKTNTNKQKSTNKNRENEFSLRKVVK